MPQPRRSFEITGHRVLALLLGFFLLVGAVNGYFVHQALSTYSGVVANEPYRKGLKYNERIAASEKQEKLGWTSSVRFAEGGRRLSVQLKDRTSAPLRGLKVTATLGRPVTSQGEQSLMLRESDDGRYEAEFAVLEPGAYIASVEARQTSAESEQQDVMFRERRRLWLER